MIAEKHLLVFSSSDFFWCVPWWCQRVGAWHLNLQTGQQSWGGARPLSQSAAAGSACLAWTGETSTLMMSKPAALHQDVPGTTCWAFASFAGCDSYSNCSDCAYAQQRHLPPWRAKRCKTKAVLLCMIADLFSGQYEPNFASAAAYHIGHCSHAVEQQTSKSHVI